MSARAAVRTPRAPRQRDFTPKWADPGTTLVWERHSDTDPERIGEVWSAGPMVGTRWVIDGSDYVLVRVGRSAGEVRELGRRDSAWQRRMVTVLDRLSRYGLAASDHTRWRPLEGHRHGGYDHSWTRYHVAGCEHAERPPTVAEECIRRDDGSVTHVSLALGWHRWLLVQLSDNRADRLDLCGCLTGEPAEKVTA